MIYVSVTVHIVLRVSNLKHTTVIWIVYDQPQFCMETRRHRASVAGKWDSNRISEGKFSISEFNPTVSLQCLIRLSKTKVPSPRALCLCSLPVKEPPHLSTGNSDSSPQGLSKSPGLLLLQTLHIIFSL